ncbi:MAG: NAD-dependent epimerase/dehydratase family protein [Candidatus Kapaibacterium sp.]
MNVLITGATGFIGSHLAEELHRKGHNLRVLIRETSNLRWIEHLPIEKVVGGLSDSASLEKAVEGVDYIYHIAGVVAAKNREGFYRGNVDATRNLLETTLKVNPNLKRFVHASSLAAIGPAFTEDQPVDESVLHRPITTYGQSKAEAERVVTSFSDRLPITIVRPPAVYGPRDVGIYTFFQVVAKGFAPLIGFGRKVVSLVHVDDLVRGFVLAGEHPRGEGETYFISSEDMYTWEEVGEKAAKLMGKKRVRYIRVPHALVYTAAGISGFIGKFQKSPPILDREKGKDITQSFWICSVEKAKEELGYRQQVSIDEGVKGTIEWYREQGWI